MAEQGKQVRGLSEISHLFLSSVREKQAGHAPRPQRKPPAPRPQPLPPPTAEDPATSLSPGEEPGRIPPVRAILSAHLGARQSDFARRYARSLAAQGRQVGLIHLDAGAFRLFTFGPEEAADPQPAPACPFDPRAMRDAINELNWDLDEWLLEVANPRLPEARTLLRGIDRWVALCGCGHDDVVACYRALKGVAEPRHQLSIAAVDARDAAEAQQAAARIAAVSRQFLAWEARLEQPVMPVSGVGECPVMCCEAADKAQLASAPHWQVVQELLEHAKLAEPAQPAAPPEPAPASSPVEHQEAAVPVPTPPVNIAAPQPAAPARLPETPATPARDEAEIIDLPADGASLLAAVLKQAMADLVECPVRAPACPDAILAVGRDHRLVLLANPGAGLHGLQAISQAYRWIVENRALLGMAMPQFALDAHQLPHLRLLVDHADLNAESLRPLLHAGAVSIHAFRRVRWGQRTGLLLNAA